MTTEKALREALENSTEMLRHCRCLNEEGAVAEQVSENRAALSLPETQGKPVNFPDSIYSPFNSCVFKSQCIQREEEQDAPLSQPAQGWKLVPVEPTQAMMEAAAPFPEHLRAEHPNPDDPWHEGMFIATKCDQLAARTTYRAMLAAVPAAPTQAKPTNGEGA